MDTLNLANCGTGANVGAFPCNFEPGIYKYFLLAPKGTIIPASTLADNDTLAEYLYDALTSDTPGTRWKRSGILSQFNDETDAVKTEDKDGYKSPTQFPPYNWAYDMTLQTAQFVKWLEYRNIAQNLFDLFIVDDQGNLIGTQKTDSTGAMGLGGVAMFAFYFEDMKQATTDTLVKFMFHVTIKNNKQLNASLGMVQAELDPTAWDNLLYDVNITQGAANTSTAIKVQAFTNGVGAKVSLLNYFGTVLDAAGAWVVTKNGSPITPSGVSYDADYDGGNGQMIFTVSSLSSGDDITVKLAAPSVLLTSTYNNCPAVTEGTVYTYEHP